MAALQEFSQSRFGQKSGKIRCLLFARNTGILRKEQSVWQNSRKRTYGRILRNAFGTYTAVFCVKALVVWLTSKHSLLLEKSFAQSTYIQYIEYHISCPLVGIGTLPPPLSPASMPLPPEPKRGGHTRLRVRGLMSPNSEDWRKGLAHCLILCGLLYGLNYEIKI